MLRVSPICPSTVYLLVYLFRLCMSANIIAWWSIAFWWQLFFSQYSKFCAQIGSLGREGSLVSLHIGASCQKNALFCAGTRSWVYRISLRQRFYSNVTLLIIEKWRRAGKCANTKKKERFLFTYKPPTRRLWKWRITDFDNCKYNVILQSSLFCVY